MVMKCRVCKKELPKVYDYEIPELANTWYCKKCFKKKVKNES